QVERGLVRFAFTIAAAGVEKVDRPVNHHAAPVEPTLDLVDLERDPRVVTYDLQFCSGRRPGVDPLVPEEIRDRLDVHAIVERERNSADVMARQHLESVGVRKLIKD